MKKTTMTWIGCALAALLVAALIPACSQDGDGETLPTASTSFSSRGELGQPISPLAHEDDDSEDSGGEDDESADDESEDSESEDDLSEDDTSEDDTSEDDAEDDLSEDDDEDDLSEDDDDGARARGLLFDAAGCPATFTIGSTIVTTTDATLFDCEPGCDGLTEGLPAADFCGYLTPGLPMRAQGIDNAGAVDASRIRIEDEIQATGTISVGSSALTPGTLFDLTVNGLTLPFQVGPGGVDTDDVFDAGATVRVEGNVPPLTLGGSPTFIATEVEN
jgi:hypothetical protein